MLIALRSCAFVAALLAAPLTFVRSELGVHLAYGIRAAQGAPTPFAVMAAGMLRAVFGALPMRPDREQALLLCTARDVDALEMNFTGPVV